LAGKGIMSRLSFAGIAQAVRTRHIDRVAVGYALASWLVVQAASIAMPTFDAPAWVLRAIIIFSVLGFPITLALAWFAVPHVFPQEHQRHGSKATHAALGLVAGVVVLIAADFAYLLSRLDLPAPARSLASASPMPARNSIAVLPFLNMSGDAAKDYLSDGFSEELLNDLANMPTLLVVARTSSFAFKGKNQDVRQIARILDVHSILEGSVRANGNHLRITAQLINAIDGYHLWSATYDRDTSDVLAVEDEISRAITAALTHQLSPVRAAHSQAVRAINREAWDKYLLGKRELAPRTEAGAETAMKLFKTVTRLAPEFAEGFAALARAEINVYDHRRKQKDLIADVHAALASAFALDPDNIDALSSHLDISLHELDWKSAIADAGRMQSISPHSVEVQHEMFRYYQFLGFPDLALEAARGAAKLDPLSAPDRINIAAGLIHTGRFAEAAAAARAGLALAPEHPVLTGMLCTAAAWSSDRATAERSEAKLNALHDTLNADYCKFEMAAAAKRVNDAKATADRLASTFSHGGASATDLVVDYAMCGDFKTAGKWLERSDALKESYIVLIPSEKLVPESFFDTPEWTAIYARPLFTAWRAAHDEVAADLTGG
jgi:TolB-like protein